MGAQKIKSREGESRMMRFLPTQVFVRVSLPKLKEGSSLLLPPLFCARLQQRKLIFTSYLRERGDSYVYQKELLFCPQKMTARRGGNLYWECLRNEEKRKEPRRCAKTVTNAFNGSENERGGSRYFRKKFATDVLKMQQPFFFF